MGGDVSATAFATTPSSGSRRFKMQSISTSSRKQLPTISRSANPRTSFAFEEHCSYDTQFPPNVDFRAAWIHDTGVFTTVGSSGLQL
jgi:hypothetical protein